ncbi:hypothetical protein NECAME_08152 [Necator americanus]|uniref:Uncharacterized protein n=1 Tax=Necator americanus TaxID=51031 RepID=W2TM39_NECAM|nr:hypothetical protein NECAME_08152 [Necator americanus]ETN82102.1 hypothetical protein NECAME_08152 [Necator americanus]
MRQKECSTTKKCQKCNGYLTGIVTEKLLSICMQVTPCLVADRVFLGLVPTCRAHWLTACKALRLEGGMLHIHEILDVSSSGDSRKDKEIKPLPKLQSVEEEGSVKENKPTLAKCSSNPQRKNNGTTEKTPVKRQLSRSQSIVLEMESRVFPLPRVLKEFEQRAWKSLSQPYKDFAMDCATKYGSSSPKSDHVVVDLLCCLEDAPIEKVSSKYLALNHA